VAICAGVVLLKTDWMAEKIRDLVVEKVGEALNAELRIGRLSLGLLPTAVVLQEVSFRPKGASRLFSARRIEVRIRPLELIRRRVVIERLAIDGADVTLDMLDGNLVNLPRVPPSPEPSRWTVFVSRVLLQRAAVRAVIAASAGTQGDSLRRRVARLLRAAGKPAPKGAFSMVARVTDLAIDVLGFPGNAFTVRLTGNAGSFDAPGLRETLTRLRLQAFLSGDRVDLDHLELGLGESQLALFAKSEVRDLRALLGGRPGAFQGKVVLAGAAGLARRFAAGLPPMSGTFTMDFDVAGSSPRNLRASGWIEWEDARIGRQSLGNVGARIEATPEEVSFSDTRAAFASGQVRASGRVRLGATPTLQATVRLDGVRLGRIFEAVGAGTNRVDLMPSGIVEVRGRLVPAGGRIRPELVAQVQLEIRDLLVRGAGEKGEGRVLAVPALQTQGVIEIDSERTRLADMRVFLGGSILRTRGEVQHRGWMNLEVDGPDLRLEEVGTIAGLPWSGRGKVRATVRGRPENLAVVGNFDLAGLSFAQVDLERAAGLVEYSRGVLTFPVGTAARGATRLSYSASIDLSSRVPQVRADVEILQGRSEDLMRVLRLPAAYAERYLADVTGEVHIRGSLRQPTGWGKLRLTEVSVYGERFHEVLARGAYSDAGWSVDRVTVRKTPAVGKLELYGVVTPAREISFVAVSNDLSLGDFGVAPMKEAGISGDVGLHAVLHGTLDRPEGNGRLTLRNVKVRGAPQQDSAFELTLLGKRLEVQGKILGEDLGLRAEMALSGDVPFTANVDLREFEFSSLVRGEARNVFGKATGTGEFSGALTSPQSIRGRVTLEKLVVDAGGGYTLRNRGPVVVAVQGGRITVESMEVAGRDTEVALTGSRLPGGELDFTVEGKVDLNLLAYLSPQLQSPTGTLRFKSRIAGTEAQPSLLGSGELSGMRVGFEGFPHDLSGVEARLLFTQNKVLVQGLQARFADGSVRGDGDVTLDRFFPSDFRVSIRIEDARLRYPEDFPARIGGTLHLSGNLEKQKLTGEIVVLRARYTKDVKLSDLILKKRRVAPKVYEKKKERLQIAVRVVAPDDIRILNNRADLEFGGELNVRGSNRKVGVLGVLRLVRPGIIKDERNTFKVERAFVVFKNEERVNPYLDIEGVTRVRQHDVVLSVKGTLYDCGRPECPPIEFSCGSGLAPEDCIWLLRTGLTLKEVNALSPAGRSGISTASTALDTIGAVTGFDEKLLEAVPVFDTFRLGSGFSEYSASIVPLLTIGKQLVPGVLTVYGTTSLVEPSKDFKAQLELNVFRSLSVTGEYVTLPRTTVTGAGVGQSLGNLGVDLRWRYEF